MEKNSAACDLGKSLSVRNGIAWNKSETRPTEENPKAATSSHIAGVRTACARVNELAKSAATRARDATSPALSPPRAPSGRRP